MQTLLIDTADNGTVESVHIAPIGDYKGSDAQGNAIDEHITRESLERIADSLNADGREVLMDVDHASEKPGLAKSTAAVGWFSKFFVDPVKGLFGTLKLTRMGRDVIGNREYRYVSPTFRLGENGEPSELHSVAATNLPAFAGAISPIINSEATPEAPAEAVENNETQEDSDMTKEDLKAVIMECLAEFRAQKEAAEAAAEAAEEKAEAEAEAAANETPAVDEPTVEPTVENACGKNEEPACADCADKPEDKPEVIKIEALNSAPDPTLAPAEPVWKSLHGEDFFRWCDSQRLH